MVILYFIFMYVIYSYTIISNTDKFKHVDKIDIVVVGLLSPIITLKYILDDTILDKIREKYEDMGILKT